MKPIKKLHRSSDDRILAGVAGGMGTYFNVDPLFVRLIFVLLALVQGLGILLYVIFIFIIPKEGGKCLDAEVASKKIKEMAQNKYHTVIAAGLGKYKDRVLRIGNLGMMTTGDTVRIIGVMELILSEIGHIFQIGKGLMALHSATK